MDTRGRFLKKMTAGAVGVAVAGGVAADAGPALALDAAFVSPYPPNPVIRYPSSWFVYTAHIPGVLEPFDVIVSDRQLQPLPDVDGWPDMRAAPTDATTLVLFSEELPGDFDVSPALPVASGVRFGHLNDGGVEAALGGVRRYHRWYAARVGEKLYGLNLLIFVGRDAGPSWGNVRGIAESIHLTGASK
jgi:hypothetical protein